MRRAFGRRGLGFSSMMTPLHFRRDPQSGIAAGFFSCRPLKLPLGGTTEPRQRSKCFADKQLKAPLISYESYSLHRLEQTTRAYLSHQITNIQRHLVNLSTVKLLNIPQRPYILRPYKVDSNTLPSKPSTPSNAMNV